MFEAWGKKYSDSVQEYLMCEHNMKRAYFMEDKEEYAYWDLRQYEIGKGMDNDTFGCLHKIYRGRWPS